MGGKRLSGNAQMVCHEVWQVTPVQPQLVNGFKSSGAGVILFLAAVTGSMVPDRELVRFDLCFPLPCAGPLPFRRHTEPETESRAVTLKAGTQDSMCPHPCPTGVSGAASPQDPPRVSPDRVATVMRKVMRLEDETLPGRPRFGVSALQTDVQCDEGDELCRNAVLDAVPTVGFGPRLLIPGEVVDRDWKSEKGGSAGAGSLHLKTSSCARVAACGRAKGSVPTGGWKMSPRRESAQRYRKCSPARENPDEARIGASLYRLVHLREIRWQLGIRSGPEVVPEENVE
ncbi:hypothetical protein EDB92DRAFT_2105167 [Lactarius akahatsu]|uniref:Uncharacterized protein n=1 Tax=Lactarius akahatsu TaxID=416441 RepID=A0AAD4QBG3_9AGAM|nr:hypothetical protein EDB92DRAFT_2105167 [Lactarius akahatsu]